VLTTSQDEGDIIESYKQFASSYIVKPVSMEKFINVVASFKQYWLSVVKLPETEH
jgi:DNA-binding NarL/FixJ family response regulator